MSTELDELEDDAERETSPGERRAAVLGGIAIATGLSAARFLDVNPDGKLISLLMLGFALVAGFTAVSRPCLVTVVVIAYVPFSRAYSYPLLGLPGLNGANLVLVLGFVAFVVSSFRRERQMLIGFEWVLLVYLMLGLVGGVRGQLWGGGVDVVDLFMDYRSWAAPALLFFVARGTIERAEDGEAMLLVLGYTTFLVGILTWLEGVEMRGGRSIEEERVLGILGQANNMGAFLAYYGAPLLALAVAPGRWLRRGVSFFAFLVVARAIIFTYSRGALLALAAGSAAVGGLVSPLGVGVLGAGGLAARSFPQLLPDAVRDRFAQTSDEEADIYGGDLESQLDSSSAQRLNLWRGGVAMMQEYPLIGVGLKMFPQAVAFFVPEDIGEQHARDAHNAYILTGAELGLPALLLMITLLLWIGVAGLGSWWRGRHPPERRLALACLGCLTAVMVSCMFGSRFAEDTLIGPFWCLMGALFAVRAEPVEDDEEPDEDTDEEED